MSMVFLALFGIFLPTFEMLVICVFAASLPVAFIFWLRRWLDNVRDEDPEDVERLQSEADKDHVAHHGHGHSHGVPHGH
ncbi:MAG: hypothetical protein KF833_21405 [Verrucomicrobiae bacterium]|nr:hypothetical protein [Verrucomicrobiae bacterium]